MTNGRTLRGTVAVASALLALLVLLLAGAFIIISAMLQEASTQLRYALESVRVAKDAEVQLLAFDRAAEPIVKNRLARGLRSNLALLRGDYVQGGEGERLLSEAERLIGSYLTDSLESRTSSAELSTQLGSAFGALDRFVARKVDQGRIVQKRAVLLDRRADVLAIGTAVTVLLLSGTLIWWVYARAFRPVFALATTMQRFGNGEHQIRMQESGPRELQETARQFNEMAEAIMRQRELQLAFLAGVAHDLRSPLSTVKLSLQVLEPKVGADPLARRSFDAAARQVAQLERMVGDFLEIGKLESGRFDLRLEQLDIRQVIERVTHDFRALSSHHELQLHLPKRDVPVMCDVLRIEQVLANLLSNAVKYSPGSECVEIDLACAGREAVICVTDHGVGISETDQAHLFEPFRRLGLSKEAIPGVGLGLFMVRQIVAAHGGSIQVASALGKGSTFQVRLPLSETA